MDNLRSEILNITKNKPEIGLSYYNDLLNIIDSHHDKKPDTSIETCKAIIEGVSKLIIHKIDQEPIHTLDKSYDFKQLCKKALNTLNEGNDFFDREFVRSVENVVRILGESRNDHSDISHGRASVKKQINCSDFSQMVSGFTESITVYLLRKLDEVVIDENHYNAEQMVTYNEWLDSEYKDFPIQAERYSKILFDYDKDVYYLKYEEEFLSQEQEDLVEDSRDVKEEDKPLEVDIIDLDTDFFDSDEDKQLIIDFAIKEKLHADKLSKVLDNYFFTNESPSPSKLIELFIERPTESNELSKSESLNNKIFNLIEKLTKN